MRRTGAAGSAGTDDSPAKSGPRSQRLSRWSRRLGVVGLALVALLAGFYGYVRLVEGRSLRSKIFEIRLDLSNAQQQLADPQRFGDRIEELRVEHTRPYRLPDDLELTSAIERQQIAGLDVVAVGSPNGQPGQTVVVYLHGGAYIEQLGYGHLLFADDLAQRLDALVLAPVYPLAPNATVDDALDPLLAVYEQVVSQTDPSNVALVGDSAGGGLALVMAQQLGVRELSQPDDIVLISPWLDVSMSNPGIGALTDRDPMLAVYGLEEAGRLWAGDRDTQDPVVSPIFGPVTGLGEITVVVGTSEILLADARDFRDQAAAAGVSINYLEYDRMLHGFPLLPVPEADRARSQIADIINGS